MFRFGFGGLGFRCSRRCWGMSGLGSGEAVRSGFKAQV